ncbi:Uncharacterised protein [Candidatus Venteria ishoeyi]|uniref:Uncharacterized protein n=1 Tax=Candidatus Venteria ishoeyi TaxID=1899563 RepID=A0A1H6F585_9GAMM|nr:Uncharacterised protein [Candidatus Venteria ishoeyi]
MQLIQASGAAQQAVGLGAAFQAVFTFRGFQAVTPPAKHPMLTDAKILSKYPAAPLFAFKLAAVNLHQAEQAAHGFVLAVAVGVMVVNPEQVAVAHGGLVCGGRHGCLLLAAQMFIKAVIKALLQMAEIHFAGKATETRFVFIVMLLTLAFGEQNAQRREGADTELRAVLPQVNVSVERGFIILAEFSGVADGFAGEQINKLLKLRIIAEGQLVTVFFNAVRQILQLPDDFFQQSAAAGLNKDAEAVTGIFRVFNTGRFRGVDADVLRVIRCFSDQVPQPCGNDRLMIKGEMCRRGKAQGDAECAQGEQRKYGHRITLVDSVGRYFMRFLRHCLGFIRCQCPIHRQHPAWT